MFQGFDATTTADLHAAYELAISILGIELSPALSARRRPATIAQVAAQIQQAAEAGERDIDALAAAGLVSIERR